MKIVLLAHALRGGGGLVGGHNFISALAQAKPEHQYLITVPAECGYEDIKLPAKSKFCVFRETSILSRFKMEFKTIPQLVSDFKADAVMGLGNHGLKNITCPQAIWVRNAYLAYPAKHFQRASFMTRLYIGMQRYHFKRTLKNTNLLFCQTPVMLNRICDYYDYDKKNAEILPNAFSNFIDHDKSSELPEIFMDRTDDDFYCMVLSQYYVHKNPQIILDTLKNCNPDQIKNLKFITTVEKNDDRRAEKFLGDIYKYNLQNNILNVGHIRHESLAAYYNNIDLLIMPTLIESFSVTYLEAMHFNVPILTTDLDFAHYLCGKAAEFYDPWQEDGFIEKILQLKYASCRRSQLIEAGREQLKQFTYSWNDMVIKAVEGLETLVNKK